MTRFAAAFAALLVLGTAAPAVAEPAGQVDLAVTVAFEKDHYYAADDLTVTVTVTNNGTVPATHAVLGESGTTPFGEYDWGVLSKRGQGVDLAPGESVEVRATQRVAEYLDLLTLTVEVTSAEEEATPADNTATAEATMSKRTGTVTITVYGDRDGDAHFDPGEGLGGVRVDAADRWQGRTDAAGRLVVRDVEEGLYSVSLGLPTGWEPDEPTVVVRAGETESYLRAVRPSKALRSTITLDKGVYQVGDTIRERVTITNTGKTDLAGVTARCVEGGAPNTLSGLGWGDLVHYLRPGVLIRAGETRVFEFTDVVPPGGRLYGFVTIRCWFSTAFKYDDGPAVNARAEVPGGVGSTGGYLFVDRDDDLVIDAGEPIVGAKLFLVADDGRVASRAMTDARGQFLFRDVVANNYEMRVAGPWRPRHDSSLRVGVFDAATLEGMLYPMVAGPTQPDLDAPRPTAPSTPPPTQAPPVPQAAPRPANLADTGASVVELSALGLLLVGAGTVLLFVRRRPSS